MFHSDESLWKSGSESFVNSKILNNFNERPLSTIEKVFLLHAERGDCATVRRIIEEFKYKGEEFNINCVDCLNRSALVMAIENENSDLIKLLLEFSIDVKDGLLHAIKEEFVEAVEVLLEWEEKHHKSEERYSWERVDGASATFTTDINPLILAAHQNNYEILKILLERGATLPAPHDVKCGCDECVFSTKADSLRHSQARINAYKALTSPSLISLSSSDPLLTAFELSWDLRRLSRTETEFGSEYNEMRHKVQVFAVSLLDHVRTSNELMLLLNYDHTSPRWVTGDRQTLARLKLAIQYKQKKFVAHPNVQQLLAAIWYEGVPGFRRKNVVGQSLQIVKFALTFPVYCSVYMMAPRSGLALFLKRPFVKFICHSSSYVFFLGLLGLSSQKVEVVVLEWVGGDWAKGVVEDWKRRERGAALSYTEYGVVLYVTSIIWAEIRELWTKGVKEYICNLWNLVDFVMIVFYVLWFTLRMSSLYVTWCAESEGANPYRPREQWSSFEPMLISEGAFAAGMIFSFLKLVHIFSVNPHLGPLQISLGRMIIDIVKFFFIYTLVLFAFGCGLNQLLWYYAELEKKKCYHLPTGLPDFETNDKACTIWRRYANLFETSQSLFWASFGLIDLMSFELTGIKSFTRFWAMLMFGSYSVINIIVLLNMLIAMMANSYQIISERADIEWKFARSRLWISYFEDEDVLPPPFNILPNMQTIYNLFQRCDNNKFDFVETVQVQAQERHDAVIKTLIKRYTMAEQRKRSEFGVTEDDVIEIRQDISSLRYELIDILGKNGMTTPNMPADDRKLSGRKGKIVERRILTDFSIGTVDGIVDELTKSRPGKPNVNIFDDIAKEMKQKSGKRKRKNWNSLVRAVTVSDPIGSSFKRDSSRKGRFNFNKTFPESIASSNILNEMAVENLENEKFSEKEQRRVLYENVGNSSEPEWF